MDGLKQWLQQLELVNLLDIVIVVAASLLCITVHETCHGLVACWLRDDTAKKQGRLSLNPLRHVDFMGVIMMAIVHFGWAKAVPIDMRKFRNPKIGMAVSALAGPVSNVLLAAIAMVLYCLVLALYFVHEAAFLNTILTFLTYVVVLSSGLAVFNLFPIPPLDGSKVLFAVLPDRWYAKLMRFERYGMILLAILLLTNVLDAPLLFLRDGVLDLLNKMVDPLVMIFIGWFS